MLLISEEAARSQVPFLYLLWWPRGKGWSGRQQDRKFCTTLMICVGLEEEETVLIAMWPIGLLTMSQ